jgi:hypothetical protein
MRWRDRFLFVAEAIYKSQAETGFKKHSSLALYWLNYNWII